MKLRVNASDSPDVAGNAIYRSDNTLANQDGTVVMESNGYSYDPNVSAAPAQAPMPSGFTALPSTEVEAFVLANAGARPTDRDPVDTRITAYVTSRGGNFISQEGEVGGFPVLAVNSRPLLLPASPHAVTASGYTNLEVWLHGYAAAVEPGATTSAAPSVPSIVSVH